MTQPSKDEIVAEMKRRHWFHTLEILPGVWTPGHYKPDTAWLFGALGVEKDLAGKRVLDMGCADGAHTFQMARWGGDVTAVDLFSPEFRNVVFLSQVFGIPVTYGQSTIYTFEAEPFDFVFATGVLYHLEHPMLGLQCLNKLCRGRMILESQIEPPRRFGNNSFCRFWAKGELNHDPSNFWTPTKECLHRMLHSCGFKVVREFENAKNRHMLLLEKFEDKPPALNVEDVYRRYFGESPP